MSHKPYTIYAPDFQVTSGGIRVMWGLYGALLAKGQIAYINAITRGIDSVAIYPEIAHGNPLEGTKVVRYILNKPGVMGRGTPGRSFEAGPTDFDPTDSLYYFSKLFSDGSEANNYMFLPILDTHLFKDQGRTRDKIAFFVGKGEDTKAHPQGSVLIDRGFAQDQQALADLLNECKVLYCYDPVTAMTEIARLCGCRVVMINPVYSKEAWSQYEAGMNGISWGVDEGIELDAEVFAAHYARMKVHFDECLDQFIEETQR